MSQHRSADNEPPDAQLLAVWFDDAMRAERDRWGTADVVYRLAPAGIRAELANLVALAEAIGSLKASVVPSLAFRCGARIRLMDRIDSLPLTAKDLTGTLDQETDLIHVSHDDSVKVSAPPEQRAEPAA